MFLSGFGLTIIHGHVRQAMVHETDNISVSNVFQLQLIQYLMVTYKKSGFPHKKSGDLRSATGSVAQ